MEKIRQVSVLKNTDAIAQYDKKARNGVVIVDVWETYFDEQFK